MNCDYLIIGAGVYGITLAECIANKLKKKVLLVDKRSHIGGNCFSEPDQRTGIEFHRYGTHIFHTSDKYVWGYLKDFCELNGYFHQVLTTHKDKVYQMPINLETINSFYGKNFRPIEARTFICKEIKRAKIGEHNNLEDKAISFIGRPLYEAFVKGYTMKQWGKDPKDLPKHIFTRLPVRFNYNESYFHNSRWQGLPVSGYTGMFRDMLKSKYIEVNLNTDYFKMGKIPHVRKKIIFTGPIDQLYGYRYGRLGWRSVKFEKKTLNIQDFQGTSVMNYADIAVPYTRIHEPRHLHPERKYPEDKTIIFYETPHDDPNEPYYPINSKDDQRLLLKYKKLANEEKKLIVGGRLGDYAYYDMDVTIRHALECFKHSIV